MFEIEQLRARNNVRELAACLHQYLYNRPSESQASDWSSLVEYVTNIVSSLTHQCVHRAYRALGRASDAATVARAALRYFADDVSD